MEAEKVLIFCLLNITSILSLTVVPRAPHATIRLKGQNWGTYRNLDVCPEGTYAINFQTKVEDPDGDDTALNAISLACSDGKTKITSGEGQWGKWGDASQTCKTGFLGARIKVESYQGIKRDDTGTNAIQFFCEEDGAPYKSKEGKWGDWSKIHYCPKGYKITGIRTQIEKWQHSSDDTALNSVRLQCTYFGKEVIELKGHNWGTYRNLDVCPVGTYAINFQTKVEDPDGDDTALNAISLACSDGKTKITSGKGQWGTWGHVSQTCKTGFSGARIKVESYQGKGRDDTGTNAIQFFCEEDGTPYKSKEGKWGDWSKIYYCSKGYVITGIRTQIEKWQRWRDDTALNGVELQCTYFNQYYKVHDEKSTAQRSIADDEKKMSITMNELKSSEITNEHDDPEYVNKPKNHESANELRDSERVLKEPADSMKKYEVNDSPNEFRVHRAIYTNEGKIPDELLAEFLDDENKKPYY